jgi:flagellar FliL protein
MATEAIENVAVDGVEAGASAPAKSGKRGILILAIAGVAAGAATGLFVTGPLLAQRRAAAAAAPKPEHTLEGAAATHSVENLVLNPAGSGGTRFLMVTATFQIRDGGVETQMKEHDAEVRDRILSLLGKKTVEELSDIAQREAIKQEVLASVASLFEKGAIRKVFFAQFVIQ